MNTYEPYYDIDKMMDYFEKEMHEVKKFALRKLALHVAHHQNEYALTLAYCWFDSQHYAEKIANELDLCKLDFLAINEDIDAFKEEFLKDNERAGNF